MRNYATAQALGTRTAQCDATAIHTAPDGARAYVLLDGIGDYRSIGDWTRTAARRVARAASRRGDAEAGLRHIYQGYAADPDRQDPYARRYMPSAAAVVVVAAPGEPLTVAWCGDSRAYLLSRGITRRLTADHNDRRVYPPTATYPEGGNRNAITSYLGGVYSDEELMSLCGHPAIETATVPLDGPCRLLLASDGAYEPHLDAGHDLYMELDDDQMDVVARDFVNLAVATSLRTTAAKDPARPYADNATILLADLA
ncbi:PP2C family protein-serine/threonine phosphatase [Streptomyces niveus]|uniref:PP2C family protein-serine/threonine phosphatase n=1 Tax=Streptomyces niveus TaxID=193462 RepID=UPI0036EFFCC3